MGDRFARAAKKGSNTTSGLQKSAAPQLLCGSFAQILGSNG
jgi:hypothetical protein